jgi:mono/diheme cytochrome c family protein
MKWKKVWLLFLSLILGCVFIFGATYLVQAGGLPQNTSPGQQVFQKNCTGCHTIGGGKLVGPDLQGVTQRQDPAWLQKFISDPAGMIASGDPTATQLQAQYGLTMPTLGLSAADVQAVIAYLTNPGTVAAPQPAANTGLTGNPQVGRLIFTGAVPLTNGGVNCIACHTVSGVASLGGGSLGPDLTHVNTRLGTPGLTAAITTIAFPTMSGPFLNKPLTPQEVSDLVAFFVQADQQQTPLQVVPSTWFWAAGGAGAVLLFLILLYFWPRQRRSLSDQIRMGLKS